MLSPSSMIMDKIVEEEDVNSETDDDDPRDEVDHGQVEIRKELNGEIKIKKEIESSPEIKKKASMPVSMSSMIKKPIKSK